VELAKPAGGQAICKIVNHFNKCRPRDFRRHVLSTFKTPLLPVPPTAAEAEIIGKAFKRNKYV